MRKDLEIDLADGQRKGYHTWVNRQSDIDRFHFHKKCFEDFFDLHQEIR